MTVGEKIKKLRTDNKLTQKQLADMCGMSEGMIRQYETNVRNPKKDRLNTIALALGVEFEYLFDKSACDYKKLMFWLMKEYFEAGNDYEDLFNEFENWELLQMAKGLIAKNGDKE